MGAQNVAKVFAHWRHLKHREARALTYMALIALDADKPPVYFGGWKAVAEALGLDTEGKRASSQEAFRQTIAQLTSAGAVVSSREARLGVRAEYALTLDPGQSYAKWDHGKAGNGRGISWEPVPRDTSPNETLPQVPQQNVAPTPNETLPHVPQQNIVNSPNESLPPMRTEEPQGGLQEEIRGGVQITKRNHLTYAPTSKKPEPAGGRRAIEDQRSQQLAALEARYPDVTAQPLRPATGTQRAMAALQVAAQFAEQERLAQERDAS